MSEKILVVHLPAACVVRLSASEVSTDFRSWLY